MSNDKGHIENNGKYLISYGVLFPTGYAGWNFRKTKSSRKKRARPRNPRKRNGTARNGTKRRPLKERKSRTSKKNGCFLSPEAAIVLPTAIILDILGILFTVLDIAYGIGEIPSWISDGVGIVFFGFWLLARTQSIKRLIELVGQVREKRAKIKKLVSEARKMGRGSRFAITFLGEILPIIGVLPFWTWMVYSELKNSS